MAGEQYVTPLAGTVGRTDQGVDISAAPGTPVVAIGPSREVGVIRDWFQGQPFVWFELLKRVGGRLVGSGRYWFAAEQIDFSTRPGDVVAAGQQIGRIAQSGTGTEFGFATRSGRTLAAATTGYTEGQVTPAGTLFRRQVIDRGTLRPARDARANPSLGELWIQAGGSPRLANIMAAIALAESGGKTSEVGGPNSDGSYDYGLWQINSTHSQYSSRRLLSDPLYNARAAVAIERSQGLGAWTTYNTGAYQAFLGQSKRVPGVPITRPGGGPPGGKDGPSGAETAWSSYTDELAGNTATGTTRPVGLFGFPIGPDIPLLPDLNPLNLFKQGETAVTSAVDFLKWIAWIFHPRNVLRVVEFVTGMTIMGFGIHALIQDARGVQGPSAVRKVAGEAIAATPVGRGVRVAKATARGRRYAGFARRQRETEAAFKRGKQRAQRGRSSPAPREPSTADMLRDAGRQRRGPRVTRGGRRTGDTGPSYR